MHLELEEGDADLLQEALSLLSRQDWFRSDDLRRHQQLQDLLLRVKELGKERTPERPDRGWTEEQEKTLGMIVVVVREGNETLLLDAYGPAWEIANEQALVDRTLLMGELQPPAEGIWIGYGDFHYRATGGYECPNEDFEITFRGGWRKPTPKEWERLHMLDGEFMWEVKDLPKRGVR